MLCFVVVSDHSVWHRVALSPTARTTMKQKFCCLSKGELKRLDERMCTQSLHSTRPMATLASEELIFDSLIGASCGEPIFDDLIVASCGGNLFCKPDYDFLHGNQRLKLCLVYSDNLSLMIWLWLLDQDPVSNRLETQ